MSIPTKGDFMNETVKLLKYKWMYFFKMLGEGLICGSNCLQVVGSTAIR